jgi:hypothetical protein
MADMRLMDLALQGRPAWPEIAGVLVTCALVFALLVRLDGAASRGEAERARAALAARAGADASPVTPADTRRIGAAGRIALPVGATAAPHLGESASAADDGPPSALLALFAGVGVIMALAGSALLARTSR